MAFAESILSAQMSCTKQDSVSRFPLVHFPLSSHSHCFQQSSRAEKEVKAKEACVLLLRASWRAGRGRATRLHSSPQAFPQMARRCLGAGGYFIVGPETDR